MDSSDPLVSFLIIILSLLASAFFSGSEIAFVSANRLRIEMDKQQGRWHGHILSFFYRKPSYFIGAMLVGNNIALVVYGIQMGDALTRLLLWTIPIALGEALDLIVQTLISTLIILVTAEFLPKALFSINANNSLRMLAFPLSVFYFVLWVPMMITVGISEIILRSFLGKEEEEREQNFGKVDLDHYVKDVLNANKENGDIDREIQIFQNALDFSKVKTRDCMVPRNEIVALAEDASIDELHKVFMETKLSKILIYRDNIDHIIGYIHSYELFKSPESIKTILLPLFIVPETMSVQEVLKQFIQQKRGIAVVVDEFGGTSGMLTIEDVIEEIFGEIEDEHDTEQLTEIKLGNSEYLFSGRLEIDQINERFNLELPESSEYETLGGLIIQHLEEIPEPGDKLNLGPLVFTVESLKGSRIDKVRLKIKQDL